MDFRLDQAQFVVFLSAIETTAKLKIASTAARAIAELSGVDPLMLPLPDNAPPEIPRIQLQNEAAGWTFTYAPTRVDLLCTPKAVLNVEGLPNALIELQKRAVNLWNLLGGQVSAKGNRLAQVVSLAATVKSAAGVIRANFLSDRAGDQVAEAQVHFLGKLDVAGLLTNRWVRILSQEASPGQMLVQVDFNTVAERQLDVNPRIIADFSAGASKALVEVLQQVIGEVA